MRKNYFDDIENKNAYPGNIPGYDIENAEECLKEDEENYTESIAWSMMAIAKLLMDIRDELRKMNGGDRDA
ncbi:MAG: hypothetical protein IIY21_09025 [Clostridiales bacterium]|nr:hypothetical protein [Clostridiales bacterium]